MALKSKPTGSRRSRYFTSLRSSISNKDTTEPDISCRLGKAVSVFQRLCSILTSNHISMMSKLSLYNSVIPVAIYASEILKSNNNLAHKFNIFHHRCLQKVLKLLWLDYVTNNDVHQGSAQRKMSETVKEGHLKMLGQILRMP